MEDVNWWLMALSFLLGLLLTFALMIRRVTREVPVTESLGARGPSAPRATVERDTDARLTGDTVTTEGPTTRMPAAGAAAAGAAAAGGAAAAKFTGGTSDTDATAKISAVEEPYGAGSARAGAGGSGPSGWTIKGNEDSMLYHTPDSPSYKQTIAEIWFREESAAERAGFTRWDKGRATGDTVTTEGPTTRMPAAGAAAAGAAAAGGAAAAKFTGGTSDTDATAKISAVEEPYGAGSARAGAGGSGPSGWTIKGNEDSMLYHTLDSPSYKQTIAEVWFREESAAERAGFTRWDKGRATGGAAKFADVPPGPHGPGSAKPNADGSGPSGWTVKGNEDSMLYHSPESPAYAVTVAEVWFRDEETARAAGFSRWDSGKSQRGQR